MEARMCADSISPFGGAEKLAKFARGLNLSKQIRPRTKLVDRDDLRTYVVVRVFSDHREAKEVAWNLTEADALQLLRVLKESLMPVGDGGNEKFIKVSYDIRQKRI